MTVEIERRFLLTNDAWRAEAGEPRLMSQGYLSVEKERTIRVRIVGEQAWLTLKGWISDVTRSEFEYEIPLAHAREILHSMCPFRMEKRRYEIRCDGFTFEIDEYAGDNAPLVVAEIELPAEDAAFPRPAWLGREITSDGRFTNAYLSKHPYAGWSETEKAV